MCWEKGQKIPSPNLGLESSICKDMTDVNQYSVLKGILRRVTSFPPGLLASFTLAASPPPPSSTPSGVHDHYVYAKCFGSLQSLTQAGRAIKSDTPSGKAVHAAASNLPGPLCQVAGWSWGLGGSKAERCPIIY